MKRFPVLAAALIMILTACSQGNGLLSGQNGAGTGAEAETTVYAMDTYMDLKAYGTEAEEALTEISAQITALDGRLSVTDENSEIYALNHAEGQPVKVSEETLTLIRKTVALGKTTGDALDISIYPVLRAWGFTTEAYQVPDAGTLADLLQNVDDDLIETDETASTATVPAGMEIDLGSVAKGYAGDCAVSVLKEHGVTSALLNLGASTIRVLGTKPDGSDWRVAIQDPDDPDGYAGILTVSDCAVDTSGGYERYFTGDDGEVYWHILDPKTGYPAKNGLVSVTIVSDDSFTGDGLSTACFVMGAEETIAYWQQHQNFEFVLLTEDGSFYVSEGLKDAFAPYGSYENAAVTVVAADS